MFVAKLQAFMCSFNIVAREIAMERNWYLCVLCACMSVCVYVPHGSMSRVTKQKHRKGQADVSSQFSLGHRWQGEQNVRLRLGGYVEEGS